MGAQSRTIRDYFKSSQPVTTKLEVRACTSDSLPSQKLEAVTQNAVTPSHTSDIQSSNDSASFPDAEPTSSHFAHQLFVNNSDDEGADSDSSLEDLTELLQCQSAAYHSRTSKQASESKTKNRSKTSQSTIHSPFATMPKYKFDMSMLVTQAETHEETEASALRLQALLDEATELSKQSFADSAAARNGILESVIAEGDESNMDKVLQAVKRTEATKSEKSWYFFGKQVPDVKTVNRNPPVSPLTENWQRGLIEPRRREEILLSGFARDMLSLGDDLPQELFMWILDEICLERRDELREAYCDLLLSAPSSAFRFLDEDAVANMLHKLGGRREAICSSSKLDLASATDNVYEGREWNALQTAIRFLGNVSRITSPNTCTAIMSLFTRLCFDSVVWDNVGLLSVTQRAMFNCCEAVRSEFWDFFCRDVCRTVFCAVEQPTLRLQVLCCMAGTCPRLHELRRRLAISFFCEDSELSTQASANILDLWEIGRRLDGPRFKIDRNTDYLELAALMCTFDIAVDNGHSDAVNLVKPGCDHEFNRDVDVLGARIKAIWSSINDTGASFVSRIEAKEVMEGVRHRLVYAVRTRPKPKQGVFDDWKESEDQKEAQRQSKFMEGRFKRIKTTSSVGFDGFESVNTAC